MASSARVVMSALTTEIRSVMAASQYDYRSLQLFRFDAGPTAIKTAA
jgi:hypothetical protein